jgi:plastocyanin
VSSKIVSRLCRCLPILSIAALAGALVGLPAVAGSETSPTIEAVNMGGGGYYGETHAWSPATASVGAGGVLTLSNPSDVPHGVEWVGGPEKPACSGIPVGMTESASGTKWSGTCTFAKPGTYTFYCTVHHSEMTGIVTVSPGGATSVEMPPMPPTGGSIPPAGSNGGAPSGGSGPSGVLGSLLAGGSRALKLASSQHGPRLHGSIDVSQAGAGSAFEVNLLASGVSLAKAHRPSAVRVGHLLRPSVKAGIVSFSVGLTARGRSALRRHKRLALAVRIVLRAPSVPPVTVTRAVVLHA